jgi:membrane-bound lytic murein transglycosylase D
LNNLPLDDTLQPGQHLRVELTAMARKYAVAPGDSLWIIARKFNVTVKQLQKWNGLRDHQLLRPGQTLFVGNTVSDAA